MFHSILSTDARLKAELNRCEYCQEKPCREACPAHCSPADFIMAAKGGRPGDYIRAAREILSQNPFGTVCGLVCPDTFCMKACSRALFDAPINIPEIQAAVMHEARRVGLQSGLDREIDGAPKTGKNVGIIGGGPAGLAAAALLARQGHLVTLFEASDKLGGACQLIPVWRLPKEDLDADIEFAISHPLISVKKNTKIENPANLLSDYSAVIIAAGCTIPNLLGISGEQYAISFIEYLSNPQKFSTCQKVAVVGGGAVAIDCAQTAKRNGAEVELFVRRTLADMPITSAERNILITEAIDVTTRTRVTCIIPGQNNRLQITTCKTQAATPHAKKVIDVPNTETQRDGFDLVVMAIGAEKAFKNQTLPGLFYAGDVVHGETTVVEASAQGKKAAQQVDAWLKSEEIKSISKDVEKQLIKDSQPTEWSPHKNRATLPRIQTFPVSLATEFFGIPLQSPFLLSAAPHTDGFEQMKAACEAGWPGGIMKTAFDGIPIHIPGEYMFSFTNNTYGNCDNVSGHSLERVAREVEQLRVLFPQHFIAASTGGPVTGNDAFDRSGWQSNTKKLENAGAMLVEYSLSCPQGGDGSDGSIVSQNAALSAKIIDWVLECSEPSVPKLFKLSAAVTSIVPIVRAISEVFAKYPHKKAGITLANSFPSLGLRSLEGRCWDEGVVVGMSGEGVFPISCLTLASVASLGVQVSGNGGAMNYMMAAHFLALGCKTVQFCNLPMKHGLGIIQDLHFGLSYLLQEKGMKSVSELIGCAAQKPITDFMELPATKKISAVQNELCVGCGNCAHCGYQAISLPHGKPIIDASRCVGCSICVSKCFTGALRMRTRTESESAALKEH